MKCTQGTSAELHELVGTRPDSDFIIKTLQEQAKERAGHLRLQPSRGDKSSQSDKVWRKTSVDLGVLITSKISTN